MSELSPILRRLNDWNAVLALAALGCSVWVRSALPAAVAGVASLLAFFIAGRPREKRLAGVGTANALTLLRLLIAFTTSLLFWRAPELFAVGAVTVLILDGVDGWLARRLGEASLFGAYFDMETDSYLIAMLCLVLYLAAGLGAWVLLAGSLRYLFVVGRRLQGDAPARERRSRFGRVAFVTLAVSLLVACLPTLRAVSPAFAGVGLLAVSISFAQDFRALILGAGTGVGRG